MNLKSLLDKRKCFKLICGAGNENLDEIEKLVALYSAAGCCFFDFAADEEVLNAAQKGLDFSIPKNEQNGYVFCISIGTKNDQHVQKAKIDKKTCVKCGICVGVCPQNAINRDFQIIEEYCIGCFRCKAACKFSSIEGYSKVKNFENLLTHKLSCIELHASGINEKEADDIWKNLNENFEGFLSICIGRSILGNERILDRIRRLTESRKPYTTIIQADGSPMSGGEDDFKTTLQAVAMGELVQKADLPVYILLSGGTNSKTANLANICGVNINGIAVGSYARKIVKEYIDRDDFLKNKAIFDEALKISTELVNKITF